MKYLYHYTTLENWEKIQKEGLQPRRLIDSESIDSLPALAHKPAVFLLPSPAPESWLDYNVQKPLQLPHPCSILAYLLYSVIRSEHNGGKRAEALVLLKIRLLPSDDVRIGDFDRIIKRYPTSSRRVYSAAYADYCQSVTKLRDKFNAVAAKKIPEVLCFNAIPANRIEFIEQTSVKTFDEISSYVEQKRKSQNHRPKAANRSAPAAGAARPRRSAP